MTGVKYVVMWVKKKKESKIFIRLFIYLAKDVHYMASCLGDKKIVQDKQFDSHLTGVRNSKRKFLLASQDNSTSQGLRM